MVPSSTSLIGSNRFPVDGMNDEMCAATTSLVLSGFIWNVYLISPKIYGFGGEFCGWSGCWGIVRSCREGPESTTSFVVFSY